MGNCSCPVAAKPGCPDGQEDGSPTCGSPRSTSQCVGFNDCPGWPEGPAEDEVWHTQEERGVDTSRSLKELPLTDWVEEDNEDEEANVEPKPFLRSRTGAVCAEPMHKGFFKDPYWNKHRNWEEVLLATLSSCASLQRCGHEELRKYVIAMEIHLRYVGQAVVERGEPSDGLFVVLEGSVVQQSCAGEPVLRVFGVGEVINEYAILWRAPCKHTLKANKDTTLAKLCRMDYINLGSRIAFKRRETRQEWLRQAKLLEMMDDEGIAKLADVLTSRTYKEGAKIITQGEPGEELFILASGEASVTVRTADHKVGLPT